MLKRRKGTAKMKRSIRIFLLGLALTLGLVCGVLAEESALTLPGNLTVIDEEAFYGDVSIDKVVLPDRVQEIRARAFAGSSLTQIDLPDSLTFIDGTAFDGPDKVAVTANEGTYAYEWAVENGYIISYAPLSDFLIVDGVIEGYYGPGGNVVIPPRDADGNPIIAIADAFYDSTTITGIVIPDTVVEIASFRRCTALKKLVIPESVETMLLWPLAGCTNLTELTIPGTLEVAEGNSDLFDRYGESGDAAPEKLTKVTISNSGTNLDVTKAFSRAENLSEFAVMDGNITYNCVDGVLYNAAGTKLIKCPNAKTLYTFSNDITELGDRAFCNCWKLTRIEIPDSVTVLGDNVFGACASLVEVSLPAGLTGIGDSMFYNCDSLTEFVIPDGVTTIGDYAFAECDSLAGVTIPSSVTSIGVGAFSYCSDDLTIYGATGSYAETYANKNNIPFVPVNDVSASDFVV